MLALVPRRADAELGPPLGQHVERRDGLGEQAGVAVGHAGDQQAEADGLGVGGEEGQRRVALEHRVGHRPHGLHLEPVVHDRQVAQPDGLGCRADAAQLVGERGGTAGDGELGDVDGEAHGPDRTGVSALEVKGRSWPQSDRRRPWRAAAPSARPERVAVRRRRPTGRAVRRCGGGGRIRAEVPKPDPPAPPPDPPGAAARGGRTRRWWCCRRRVGAAGAGIEWSSWSRSDVVGAGRSCSSCSARSWWWRCWSCWSSTSSTWTSSRCSWTSWTWRCSWCDVDVVDVEVRRRRRRCRRARRGRRRGEDAAVVGTGLVDRGPHDVGDRAELDVEDLVAGGGRVLEDQRRVRRVCPPSTPWVARDAAEAGTAPSR